MRVSSLPAAPSAAAPAPAAVALAALGAACLAVLMLGPSAELPAPAAPAASAPSVAARALPSLYVPNAGQAPHGVRFAAPGAGGGLLFRDREVVNVATGLRMRFVGGAMGGRLVGSGRRPAVVNILRGSRAHWRTHLPTFAGVAYAGLYAGVALRVDGAGATWTIAPGADPAAIRWRYPGATAVRVRAGDGALVVVHGTAGRSRSTIVAAPLAWQPGSGARRAVDVRYAVDRRGRVGFALGPRNPRARLTVAIAAGAAVAAAAVPAAAATVGFSTFLGGKQWDEAMAVQTDAAGATYLAGFTESVDARTANPIRRRHRGIMDVYVAKLAADGTLRYATFLGGADLDVANALAVDRAGNAYVAGRTASTDFPVRRAEQPRIAGRACQAVPKHGPRPAEPCHDAFVAKLSASGGALVYSTYLGGSENEEAIGVAVDRSGRAYVTGNTGSSDFPTRRALQRTFRSRCISDVPCPTDAFVAKLSADGRTLVYGTYLGGTKSDTSAGIAVDRAGAAYITGSTRSPDFPTRGARQGALRGRSCGPPPDTACPDAFVVKLRPDGRRLSYGTYLGGTDTETAGGIAVDRAGNAYLTGSTQSTDFPTVRPFQPAIGNSSCSKTEPVKELCDDAYVARLSADGRRLAYSSFLGGNAEDVGLGIAVDTAGVAYVAGSTDSRAFRLAAPLQPAIGGGIDAYVAAVGPNGALRLSTFLGGNDAERANGVAVDPGGRLHLAGRTKSPNFPIAAPLQGALAGDYDMFVAMLR